MEAIAQLWVPILIATVLCFVASSLMWMVLPHHKKDWPALPADINLSSVDAGQYVTPRDHMTSDWSAFVLVRRGRMNMGSAMLLWALNQLIIATLVAYLVYYTLPRGTDYMEVFRIAGTGGVLGYMGTVAQKSIWWGWKWRVTIMDLIDGLIYALLVAGSFAFYWS